MDAQHFSAAESLGWSRLAELAREGSADSVGVADVLDRVVLARQLQSLGATEITRGLAARAVRIRERAVPRDDTLLAKSLLRLGQCLRPAGLVDSALTCYQQALALQEAAFGPNDVRLTTVLNSLSATYRAAGDYTRSRASLLRALDIRERQLGPEAFEVGRLLSNVGALDIDEGDLASARQHFERSLQIKQKALGPRGVSVGLTLISLGHLRSLSGDPEAARRIYEESVSIMADSLAPSRTELLTARLNLVGVLIQLNALEEAREHLTKVKEVARPAPGNAEFMAQLLDDEANLARRSGALAEAESLYRETLEWQRRAHGTSHPEVASALHDLGSVMAERGALDAARDTLARELEIVTATLGPTHPHRARALAGLARLDLKSGSLPAAIRFAIEAERISTDHARLLLRSLPEETALRLAAARERGLPIALAALARMSRPPDSLVAMAFDAVIRGRALVLDELASRRHVAGAATDSLTVARAGEFARASQMLANLYVRGAGSDSPERYRERLAAAAREREATEESLAVSSNAFRRDREQEAIGLARVMESLPRGAALVAYVGYSPVDGLLADHADGASRLMAFVIRRDRTLRRVKLGSAGRVDSLVRAWRVAIGGLRSQGAPSAAAPRLRRAGNGLRARMWDPIGPLVAGASRIIVVPDGSLHLVSVGSLPVAPESYLIEKVPTLETLSAERDLVRATAGHHAVGLLVLGAPDYDHAPMPLAAMASAGPTRENFARSHHAGRASWRSALPPCTELDRARIERLGEAERESEEVAAIWNRAAAEGPTTLLFGERASEEAFKRLASGAGAIHVATHGFFLDRPCADEGPLLRSGLFLAGAARRDRAAAEEEDGVLTAEEIAALDLSGVGSVTLSACETGLGDVRGDEGVFGLRRAFQAAGAGALVMSLWKVDDLETRRWMREFYEAHLERHRDVFESVRIASLRRLAAARREGRGGSPSAWGAFIATGSE